MAPDDNSALRRQLNSACQLMRNGEPGDDHFISSYTESPHQANLLLNLITQCWMETTQISGVQQSGNTIIEGSASELLRVAISIDSIAQRAIKTIIECIQNGHVCGRSAIYCTSEVRVALLCREFSKDMSRKDILTEAIDNARSVAEQCIRPFFAANKNKLNLHEASICLDLFPDAINFLSFLRRKLKRSRKYEIELLDTFMSNEWHSAGFLSICCTLCELFSHLKTRHLEEIKARLLISTALLKEKQSEDFAGVLRVCLRMFEQSHNACWIHVLRVLHSSVPSNQVQTVATLLEQIFSQAPVLCHQVISIIEDDCVRILRVISTSASQVHLTHTSTTNQKGNTSKMFCTDNIELSHIIQPTYFSTHTEIKGTPSITMMDIQLLLICSRARNGAQRVDNEVQLPSMLFDIADKPVRSLLAVSRALIVAILCHTCLIDYKDVVQMRHLYGVEDIITVNDVSNVPQNQQQPTTATNSNFNIIIDQALTDADPFKGHDRMNCLLSSSSSLVNNLLCNRFCNEELKSVSQRGAVQVNIRSSASSSSSSSSSSSFSSFSSSLEEYSSESMSWISSAKASELLSASLCLSCCPYILDQTLALVQQFKQAIFEARMKYVAYREVLTRSRIVLAVESALGNGDATEKILEQTDIDTDVDKDNGKDRDRDRGRDEGEDINVDRGCRAVSNCRAVSSHTLLSELIVTIFSTVPECRPAALTVVLKGVLVCGDYVPYKMGVRAGTNRGAKQLNYVSTAQSKIIEFATKVFHTILSSLCVRYPNLLISMHNIFDVYVPLLALIRAPLLPAVLYPIVRISGLSKVLLSSVGQEDQVQVMHALLHGFSLQLPCRRVLYTELITLLQPLPLPKYDKCKKLNENVEGGWSDQTEGSKVVLSSQLLSTLTQRVHARLSSFLTPEKFSNNNIDNSMQHERSLKGADGRNEISQATLSSNKNVEDSGSFIPLTISSTHCIQSYRTLRGKEFCLAEDFSLLITLSYALGIYSNRTGTIADIVQLSKKMLGFESHHTTFNNSQERQESCSSSWDSREGTQDFGSTYFFLSALTRFSAAGFTSPSVPQTDDNMGTNEATVDPRSYNSQNLDSGSRSSSSDNTNRVDTGGRSFNMDVPLYNTTALQTNKTINSALTTVQNKQNKSDAIDKKQIMIIKENEDLQNRLTHIACCYSLLSGYLRCFISTVQFLQEHVHPVQHEYSDSTFANDGDKSTSTSTSSASLASNILSLRHAIIHIQGQLDILLEVSVDLSSSSTVIPSQDLGSANSLKSSSSCVVTVAPIPVIVMNIDGHTSQSASVTARLVGMSSLALTENRSAHKKAQKPVSAESSSLDADTCLPLSVDASVLLIENALDLFTTHPTDDVTFIGGSNNECISGDPHNASVPLLIQSNSLSTERGQELRDATSVHTEHHQLKSNSNTSSHHPKPPSTCTPALAPTLTPTLLHALPLSARLGALGHACHQASLTATSILSIPKYQSTTSGSNHQQDLGILLTWVFRAHQKIGSIEVENGFLSEASDAAELMLRRHSLHGLDPHANAISDSNANNGRSIKYNRQVANTDHQQSGHSIGDNRVLDRQERASGEPQSTAYGRESSSSSSRDTSLFDEEKERERGMDNNRFTGSEYDRNVSSGSVSTYAHTDNSNQGASSSSSSVRRGHDVTQSFGCGSSGTSMSQSSTRNSTSNRAADTPSNREHIRRWSDDSSEESEDGDILDITTHTKQHSASTPRKNDPLFKDSFSLSVSHFPDTWKGSVDRYDIPCDAIEDYYEEYDNAVSGMNTRSNASSVRTSNIASERTVQRVRALAEEALRYTLFALRREILWAATRILEVIRVFDTDSFLNTNDEFPYSPISFDYSGQKIIQQQQIKSKKILNDGMRFKYAYFCASELYLAVADGLTMKTLKAYLDVLLALISFDGNVPQNIPQNILQDTYDVVDNRRNDVSHLTGSSGQMSAVSFNITGPAPGPSPLTPLTDSLINEKECSDTQSLSVASIIQNSLKFLDQTHQSILCNMVQIMLQYCGQRHALDKCEEFILSIGSKNFVSKVKKERAGVTANDDQEPCKKIKMSLPAPVPRAPLTMLKRSADVALYSSSAVLLLPESSEHDPSDHTNAAANTASNPSSSSSSSSNSSTLPILSTTTSSITTTPTAVHGEGSRTLLAAVDCSATRRTERSPALLLIPTRQESSSNRNDIDDNDDSSGDSDNGNNDDDNEDRNGPFDADSLPANHHTIPKIISTTSTSTSIPTSKLYSTPNIAQGMPKPNGIVTMKSSDTILGHILRHVDKCMVTLGRDIIKNKNEDGNITCENENETETGNENQNCNGNENVKSGNAGCTRTVPRTHNNLTDNEPNSTNKMGNVLSQKHKESSSKHSNHVMKNRRDTIYHTARQICRCIFVLFTETPTLNISVNTNLNPNPISPGIRTRNPRIANRINSSTAHNTDSSGSRELNYTASTGGFQGVRDNDDISINKNSNFASDARNVHKKNILLRNVSERRKCQALSMATKYISHCNKDCLRLLKDIIEAFKARNVLFSSTYSSSTRYDGNKRRKSEDEVWGESFQMAGRGNGKVKGKKRGYGFSDSDDDDEEGINVEIKGSRCEDELGEEKGRVVQKENDEMKESESACGADDDDSDIDVRHSLKARTTPHIMFVHPKSNVPYVQRTVYTPYSFLEALLSITNPSCVLGAREWYFNKKNLHDQNKNIGNLKNATSSSVTSKSNKNENVNENENGNENGKKISGNNSSSDKHAHSLIFKIEELEWRLLQLTRELDKQRRVQCNRIRKKSSVLLEDLEQAGSIPSLYPPSLSPVMQLIDAEGRALIKQLQNSSEIYAKIIGELTGTRGHWNTANKSNQNDLKNRGKDEDGSSSDEHDDEYGEGEGDDYGSSGIDSDTSNSDDEDIQEEDEGGKMKRKRGGTAKGMQERNSVISQRSRVSILNAATGRPSRAEMCYSKKGTKKSKNALATSSSSSGRLRSRNSVIDDWLGEEDGSDTYADLEDFLVE